MRISMEKATKSHWNHADIFDEKNNEYIKSFIHKDYSWGIHTHSFYELNIVLSGEGYHTIEEMSYQTKVGNVFLIPPYIQHGYISTNKLDVYHMIIHRDYIHNCLRDISRTEGFILMFETEPYLRARYQGNMFLELSKSELEDIQRDIMLIENCSGMPRKNIYINSIAGKIICHLCILMLKSKGIQMQSLNPKKELLDIADSLSYIHQNFDQKLTVSLLAEKLNMSRTTYIRQFTKICNCSPYSYIKQYRIKKAKEYLLNTEETITSVAQKCGFYDASHLRKCLAER